MAYPCEAPHPVHYRALCTYIRVRCRRCASCLKARQHVWVIRAAREQVRATRTWFGTFTFGPKRRAAIQQEASRMDHSRPQHARLTRAAGWFVTNFFKRLRKAGFEVRYCVIAEPHRDGFPHFHAIIHDQQGNLSWKDLTAQWSAGFSVFKLVRDAGAIRYITKYLAKGRYGKIRASAGYGADLVDEAAISDSVQVVRPRRRDRRAGTTTPPNDEGKQEESPAVAPV